MASINPSPVRSAILCKLDSDDARTPLFNLGLIPGSTVRFAMESPPHDPPTSMTLSHASAVWMVTFWRNRYRGGIGRSRGTGDAERSEPEARMTSLRLRRALPRAEVRRVVVLDIDGLHTSHPVRQVRRGLATAEIY